PPDPPPGHGVHHYAFQVFALDASAPPFSDTPGRDEVLEALRDHAIASGCLIGTYERPDGSIKEGEAERAAIFESPSAAA
ncbi:MAG: YbhB/YbcL family Raf kinase inhibitor-like protein, partial [Caldimonas sp.]